jgi:hypothetical protein
MFTSGELNLLSSAVVSMSQLLCKPMLKMGNYAFSECSEMRLILGEARCNGTIAVRLCAEEYQRRRLQKPRTIHAIDRRTGETGTVALLW